MWIIFTVKVMSFHCLPAVRVLLVTNSRIKIRNSLDQMNDSLFSQINMKPFSERSQKIRNFILLLTKHYIYSCRCFKLSPSLTGFTRKLAIYYKTKQFLYKDTVRGKMWDPYLDLITEYFWFLSYICSMCWIMDYIIYNNYVKHKVNTNLSVFESWSYGQTQFTI